MERLPFSVTHHNPQGEINILTNRVPFTTQIMELWLIVDFNIIKGCDNALCQFLPFYRK